LALNLQLEIQHQRDKSEALNGKLHLKICIDPLLFASKTIYHIDHPREKNKIKAQEKEKDL
jgi:hypothetical protein